MKILIFIYSIIIYSCDLKIKYDDFNTNGDKPIVFSKGWGEKYKYPIILDLSNQILDEDKTNFKQIENAVSTWNKAIGKKIIYLRSGSNNFTGNSFNDLYLPFSQNINGIYFDQLSNGNGGWIKNTGKSANLIATTIYISNGSFIIKASIRMNRDTYIFGDTTVPLNNKTHFYVDLESIILHELGHVLGLGHVLNERDSVMYPYISIGENSISNPTTFRVLSDNDIIRIRSIYVN
ncbi:matrixin family metalloprotease [Silvanigrella aquatica]|uniref:Peptidase M10 metallopeptidase domain-containing protein n=1 Tax=Silvanigrella aquatica TaxID=1915309 RepID=A0A1L4D2N0_9BACT|nr:matrixin family metalloprotease [Silvanigrella aquatica]APJ04454.1 hypothetical protein AXG55_11255 [Silvanigrella aquatica]